MTTVFHAWSYGRFAEIQSSLGRKKVEIQSSLGRKKLHETNEGSNFLGGRFSNRDNVKALIQFRIEIQPQHLKRRFFFINGPIHFRIKNTSVISPVKQSKSSFSNTKINKPLPAPVFSVSQIKFKFKSPF